MKEETKIEVIPPKDNYEKLLEEFEEDSDKEFQIIEEIDEGNYEDKESDCSHSVGCCFRK